MLRNSATGFPEAGIAVVFGATGGFRSALFERLQAG